MTLKAVPTTDDPKVWLARFYAIVFPSLWSGPDAVIVDPATVHTLKRIDGAWDRIQFCTEGYRLRKGFVGTIFEQGPQVGRGVELWTRRGVGPRVIPSEVELVGDPTGSQEGFWLYDLVEGPWRTRFERQEPI